MILLPGVLLYSESKEVRFGSDMDYPPLSSRIEVEGTQHPVKEKAIGFDMDLLSKIEKVSDIRPKIITGTWPKILTMLKDGRLDAVTGIIRTEDRQKMFDFTVPYFYGSYVIFTHRESKIDAPDDLVGKSGAILASDAAIESFLTPHDLHKNVTYTSSFTKSLRMVNKKEVEYSIAPLSLGNRIIQDEGMKNITSAGRPLLPIRYRIAVKKGNSSLLFELNEAIYELRRNGSIHGLYQKWKIKHPFDRLFEGLPFSWHMLVTVSLTAFIVICTLLFLLLRIYVRRKVLKYEEEKSFLINILNTIPIHLFWEAADGRFKGNNTPFSQTSDSQGTTLNATAPSSNEISDEIKNVVLRTASPYVSWEEAGGNKLSVLPIHENGAVKGTLFCRENTKEEERLRNTIQTISKKYSELQNRVEELEVNDPLTGLYNMNYMKKRLSEEIALYKRYGSPLSLILFNYPITDNYGAGTRIIIDDQEIRTAAEKIQGQLRNIDIVGRIDGGTFLVLLPQTVLSDAEIVASKIVSAFGEDKLHFSTFMYRGEEMEKVLMNLKKPLEEEQKGESA